MNTVIFQFEYEYGEKTPHVLDKRLTAETQYVIQACTESVQDYADKHGYDYRLITNAHETSPVPVEWYDRDWTCEWIYWLNDLADEYEHIIVIDTDVLVVDDSVPFPINNTGYFCLGGPTDVNYTLNGKSLGECSQYFTNSGVIKLDRKTAKKLYDWFVNYRNDDYEFIEHEGYKHRGDQVHILKYLLEHPEDYNPNLPKLFNVTPRPTPYDEMKNFDEPAYFWHLVTDKKINLLTFLFTNTEKHDRI